MKIIVIIFYFFHGNYAPYGYEKDEEDKHKIVIDQEVEYVVRKIFSMKLEGYSSYSIAKHLNDNGIPSPMEHKKAKGIRYKTGLQRRLPSGIRLRSIVF